MPIVLKPILILRGCLRINGKILTFSFKDMKYSQNFLNEIQYSNNLLNYKRIFCEFCYYAFWIIRI